VLGWLTRLFRQRVEADASPAVLPPPPQAPLLATPPAESPLQAIPPPTDSDAPIEAAEQSEIADPALEEPVLLEIAPVATDGDADARETCPTCGKTGVFAGPPGQRFCTYCALRDELFERSAAATE
jgi:hypothetical protein